MNRFQMNPIEGHVFIGRNGTVLFDGHNDPLNGGSLTIANLLSGRANFRLGAIYFEFENLLDPGDSPIVPAFSASDDISYYTDLAYGSTKDFVRAPIIIDPNIIEQATRFVINVTATTSGSQGQNGLDFSEASNSVVYGSALIATPNFSDPASDIVLARSYPVGTKVEKLNGSNINISWQVFVNKPA